MEDAMINKEINHGGKTDRIHGVFDGHGGSDIAVMCQCVFTHVL